MLPLFLKTAGALPVGAGYPAGSSLPGTDGQSGTACLLVRGQFYITGVTRYCEKGMSGGSENCSGPDR